MTLDRPLLGIMLMLGFCVLAPIGDAVAKILGQTVPIGQLVLVRFAVQAIVLIPLVWATHRAWRMTRRVGVLTFIRTILHIVGIGTMVTALKYLPLADAIAIAFVMPFMMLVLGKFALKEEVGMRRIIACTIGFLGTLLIVQPSFAEVGWPALLPVAVAFNFSLFMLVTRQIAKETDPIRPAGRERCHGCCNDVAHPAGVPRLIVYATSPHSCYFVRMVAFAEHRYTGDDCASVDDMVAPLCALCDAGTDAISGNTLCHGAWVHHFWRSARPGSQRRHSHNDPGGFLRHPAREDHCAGACASANRRATG